MIVVASDVSESENSGGGRPIGREIGSNIESEENYLSSSETSSECSSSVTLYGVSTLCRGWSSLGMPLWLYLTPSV